MHLDPLYDPGVLRMKQFIFVWLAKREFRTITNSHIWPFSPARKLPPNPKTDPRQIYIFFFHITMSIGVWSGECKLEFRLLHHPLVFPAKLLSSLTRLFILNPWPPRICYFWHKLSNYQYHMRSGAIPLGRYSMHLTSCFYIALSDI